MNDIPSRDEILSLFQRNANQPILSFFSREQCLSLKQPEVISKSLETGVPIPKDIQTSKDKPTECDLLTQGINKQYNSIPFVPFNEELSIQQIVQGTGLELQPHQIKVAKHLIYHRGLLAVHRTGSGKTYTAILSLMLVKMKYPNLRTVVFLPAALKSNFIEQMIKFGVSPLGIKYASPTLSGTKTTESIVSLQIEVYSFEEYTAFYKSSKVVPTFENSFIVIDLVTKTSN